LKEAGNIDYEQYVRNLAKSNPFSEPQIETLLREEKREIMAISLNVSDELIGAIFIGSSKTGAFSEVNLSF